MVGLVVVVIAVWIGGRRERRGAQAQREPRRAAGPADRPAV